MSEPNDTTVAALWEAEEGRFRNERDKWIAYADRLESAIEKMCGMSKDRLVQMHGEEALRLVRPS